MGAANGTVLPLYRSRRSGENRTMANGIIGIDHGVVAVRDLERARTVYRGLGFITTPRRRFTEWGMANYGVMFEHDFIELLGIVDPTAEVTPGLEDYLVDGEGVMAVALRADDVRSARAQLNSGGLNPSDLNETEITLEAPDGPVAQRFRWLRIAAETTPDMYMMLVQPLTPERMRRPEWLAHPNGARALIGLTVVVDDPLGLMGSYEALFGRGSSTPTDNTLAIHTGRGALFFVTEDNYSLMHPHVAAMTRRTPFIGAMSLETADVAATAAYLDTHDIPHAFSEEGVVRVAPEQACGVVLEFAPRLRPA